MSREAAALQRRRAEGGKYLMNRWLMAAALMVAASSFAYGEQEGYKVKADDRNVLIPFTSVPDFFSPGINAHTNHMLYIGPWTQGGDLPIQPLLALTHGPLLAATPSG